VFTRIDCDVEMTLMPSYQLYDTYPEPALRVTLPPWQNVVGPLAVITGGESGAIIIVCVELAEQEPPLSTVTVYVVVDEGETTSVCDVPTTPAPSDQL
jgi:hypothetical protein